MASNYRLQLADQYYMELYINDKPVPVGYSSFEVYVTQSIYTKLPVLKLIIRNEPTGSIINFFEAGDAARLTVEFGRDMPNNSRSIRSTFRQFGAPKFEPGAGGFTTTVLGLLDAPLYLNQRVPRSYNDSSSNVIQQVANEVGFNTTRWNGERTIDPTSDVQTWRPAALKYPEFVHKLTDSAYAGDGSCFLCGVSEERSLYFRNIAELIKKPPVSKFVQSSTQDSGGATLYQITEWRIRSKAGTLNNWIGYSHNAGQHNRDGSYSQQTQLDVVRGSNFLEMDKGVVGALQGGKARYEYRPIDCGNTYTNIERARYQNKRIRSTFSSVIDVKTEAMTQEDLLCNVGFEAYDVATREINAMYKGNYIIVAKTRCVVGSRYYEKYECESQGRNEDKFGTMV